jgi:1-aminocyclopropane-1-carboxylate deaminase
MIPCQKVFLPDNLLSNCYNLYVLREDLHHIFVSGNKWRKLKYHVQAIKNNNFHTAVTFGGAFSNHLVATACAGAMYGFKTVGIIRGEPVTNMVLFLCRQFGMTLHFVSRTDYKDKIACFNEYTQYQSGYYFLAEGGADETGIQGCTEIWHEIPKYADHIFCACGTGTTLAGLLKGKPDTHTHTHIHAIPVLHAFQSIQNLADKCGLSYHFHTEYTLGGYAKTNAHYLNTLTLFSQHTGILLDPVYTGKAWYAIQDLAKKQFFEPNSNIILIHTGGLTGIMGMWEKYPQNNE